MSKLKMLKKIMMLGTLGLSVQFMNAAQAAPPQQNNQLTPLFNKCGSCDCGDNGCVFCPGGGCACAPAGGSASC